MVGAIMMGMVAAAVTVADIPPATDVMGQWFTPDRDSIVHVYDCGDGSPCGRVAWIDAHTGAVTVDTHNQDTSKRGQPILGMVLLEGFKRHQKGWRGGSIYNPRDGKTYKAKIMRLDNGQLQVKGCVGPICKAQVWSPAPSGADPAK